MSTLSSKRLGRCLLTTTIMNVFWHLIRNCFELYLFAFVLAVYVALNHRQCDQIKWFLKVLGDKFSYTNYLNIWWSFGPFWKTSLWSKNCYGHFLCNFWKNWATFYLTSTLITAMVGPFQLIKCHCLFVDVIDHGAAWQEIKN